MSATKKTATRHEVAANQRLEDWFRQDSTALAYCPALVVSTLGAAELHGWDALRRRNVVPQVCVKLTAEEPQPINFFLVAPLF